MSEALLTHTSLSPRQTRAIIEGSETARWWRGHHEARRAIGSLLRHLARGAVDSTD
jgi:hypothetical protein